MTFEILSLQSDITFEKTIQYILLDRMSDDVYYENGNNESKISNFFTSLITKITNAIKKAKDAIVSLFTQKKVDDTINNLENKIKENPELGKQQVKIPYSGQLDKLTQEIRVNIDTTSNTQETIEKYKKQRNRILKGGIFVTVSLGSALVILSKLKNKSIKKLDNDLKQTTNKLKKLENNMENVKQSNRQYRKDIDELKQKNKKLEQKNEILKAKTPMEKTKASINAGTTNAVDKVDKVSNSISVAKEKAAAEIEVLQTATKDTISVIKETISAVTSASPVGKVREITKAVSSVSNTIKDVSSGETKNKVVDERIKKLKSERSNYDENLKKYKKVLNDSNAPEKVRKTALKKSREAMKNIKDIDNKLKEYK